MKPVILAYSETNDKNIAERIGMSEYSYYFVLKWFLPVLAELGEVKVVYDPLTEADREYELAQAQGRDCMLFSFAPPHRTLLPQRCPVIPVVAWEFERIPDHQWDDDPKNDWRHVLAKTGLAITHSEFARQAIQRAMPPGFPVWSIPAPVWDRFAARGIALHGDQGRTPSRGLDIHIKGTVFDSATCIPDNPEDAQWRITPPKTPEEVAASLDPKLERKLKRQARRKRSVQKLLAKFRIIRPASSSAALSVPKPDEHHIQAKGVIFASILNSRDGRKNWGDLATAFAAQFQNVDDAVLVFKLNEKDSTEPLKNLETDLRRFVWLKCRVIAFNGYLEDDDYQRFLDGIDYVVNASTGEGQCLPLMELMAMGTPAIAPDHTSMADYVTQQNAFV
ncbi:MAG TPA: glycosyltransferase, partial [Aquabacterium sp.]|nr:glycosyltransferase [Aquabacterium sp.]